MSELSNEPPLVEDQVEFEETPSHGIMLTTLLLLIAGLLMCSAMLFHYGFKAKSPDGEPSKFNLAAIKQKMHALSAQQEKPEPTTPSTPTPPKTQPPPPNVPPVEAAQAPKPDSGINKFFAKRDDKLRWPKLKLTSFGSSTLPGGDFAIINGDQVHPGQLIEDKVTLVEVRDQDVVVEYMGETRTLTVDLHN
ncbi:hypothetical protein PDESU_03528 [Pontiella desulfatans]|uniref:Type II secretion system protein GspB C-terminal domain-containing protein n=1 Tax=Pontiella desulfatans TaxID=2750659 RepID=A0A6C2U4F7_PONDE|nr:general secretion pathway protein GspB [Pontiella desulfatans]VGO14948.1 hypothetical protein PDESU_03528 [Pontiella desulfatans]